MLQFSLSEPLASKTSLGLGGPARRLVEVTSDESLGEALRDAEGQGEPLLVVGGGSNLVIADEGFPGTVLLMRNRGVEVVRRGDGVELTACAGEEWDTLVALAVQEGWAGLECLSGIPGLVGAIPIQNVGAYGQEVAQTITSVRVLDRETGAFCEFARPQCGFAYRQSRFKGTARFVVERVRFLLEDSRLAPPLAYAELAKALGVSVGARVPVDEARRAVLALRKKKSMVLDASDPESRSVGSFFVNPILDGLALEALEGRVAAAQVLRPGESMPRFASDGAFKVPAGWLIERAGLKGLRWGPVGVCSKHALALVHYGGGSTRELLDLARHVRATVRERFGVELQPEPVIVGSTF